VIRVHASGGLVAAAGADVIAEVVGAACWLPAEHLVDERHQGLAAVPQTSTVPRWADWPGTRS
jgi:hypothetical protein